MHYAKTCLLLINTVVGAAVQKRINIESGDLRNFGAIAAVDGSRIGEVVGGACRHNTLLSFAFSLGYCAIGLVAVNPAAHKCYACSQTTAARYP